MADATIGFDNHGMIPGLTPEALAREAAFRRPRQVYKPKVVRENIPILVLFLAVIWPGMMMLSAAAHHAPAVTVVQVPAQQMSPQYGNLSPQALPSSPGTCQDVVAGGRS